MAFLSALCLTSATSAAGERSNEQVLTEWAVTYNRGAEADWVTFAEQRYSAGWEPEQVAAYWTRIYERYGPLDLRTYSYRDDSGLERWAWGEISGVWVAIELRFGAGGRINATGLLQGERPAGVPLACPDGSGLESALNAHIGAMTDAGLYPGQAAVYGEGGLAWRGGTEGTAPGFIASVSKILTAAVVMDLVDQGALSLDSIVSEFVPEYPGVIGEDVTIADLLLHTSGIEMDTFEPFLSGLSSLETPADVLALHLDNVHLLLGERDTFGGGDFDYTNEGYDLALLIAERVSGDPYPELLEERVLDPAGMEHTRCSSARCGPSGIRSTVEDLQAFMVWLRTTGRLDRMMDRTVAVGPDSQGLGVRRSERGYLGHAGGRPGASAELRYYPEQGVTITTIAERRGSARIMADRLADIVRCERQPVAGGGEGAGW